LIKIYWSPSIVFISIIPTIMLIIGILIILYIYYLLFLFLLNFSIITWCKSININYWTMWKYFIVDKWWEFLWTLKQYRFLHLLLVWIWCGILWLHLKCLLLMGSLTWAIEQDHPWNILKQIFLLFFEVNKIFVIFENLYICKWSPSSL
jgi:hypothetical protein